MNDKNFSLYGIWEVTTEGDVEGKTTKSLGIYTGWVDEIALHLGDRSYYVLDFKKVKPQPDVLNPTVKNVHVSIDGIGMYGMKSPKRKEAMTICFKDRPVMICESNFYGAFVISSNMVTDEELKREKALAKLTDEDKKILGLT